jgi:hypothetical protein
MEPPPIPPPKRPVLVWIISGYYFLSRTLAALSIVIVASGMLPMREAQRSYFAALTWVDHASTSLIIVLNLTGAVLLLLLRRGAWLWFAAAFAMAIVFQIYQIVAKNWLQAVGVPGMVGAVVGWTIPVAVIAYSKYLANKRVLR